MELCQSGLNSLRFFIVKTNIKWILAHLLFSYYMVMCSGWGFMLEDYVKENLMHTFTPLCTAFDTYPPTNQLMLGITHA